MSDLKAIIEALIFASPEPVTLKALAKLLESEPKEEVDAAIAALRADWTNQDPQITAELAAYGRSAVPFNQVWLPGKNEPVIQPELLTPDVVLQVVR